jgi:hypothetical protein
MTMKQKIAVVFSVDAVSREEAEENVDRLLRYGFNALQEYETRTVEALKKWRFAEPVVKLMWK